MKKAALFIFLLLFLSHGFANGKNNDTFEGPEYPLKGGSLSINGEFLWWRPYAKIPYAITSTPSTFGSVSASTEERVHKVNMGFQPGLRLAIGLYLPVQTWKIYWWYTRLRTSDTRKTVPGENERLTPIWETISIFANDPITQPQAEAKQMLNYNVFDWSLYNFLSWRNTFVFIPSFGLRTAWIDNDLTVEYTGQNTNPIIFPVRDEARLKNHFRAIGLRGGFWVHWVLDEHWELFSNTFMSLLLSRITDRHKQVFTLVDGAGQIFSSDISNANRFLIIKSAFELALGIMWGTTFGKTSPKYIGFQAAYEAHLWPEQIQFMRLTPNTDLTSLSNPVDFYKSDLSMQGFSFKAKLEF